MRFALLLAGLLCIAPAVHAQAPMAPAGTVPAAEAHRIPERPPTPEWMRPAVAELERAETVRDHETTPALRQPTSPSWWWLVAAVAVGVIIASVIL